MFTNYQDANKYLGNRSFRVIPSIRSTKLVRVIPNGPISLIYHGTAVVTYYADGRIILKSGGYRSVTTKRRMNTYTSAQIYQRNYKWYVTANGETREFVDGMNIGLTKPHDYHCVGLPLSD